MAKTKDELLTLILNETQNVEGVRRGEMFPDIDEVPITSKFIDLYFAIKGLRKCPFCQAESRYYDTHPLACPINQIDNI